MSQELTSTDLIVARNIVAKACRLIRSEAWNVVAGMSDDEVRKILLLQTEADTIRRMVAESQQAEAKQRLDEALTEPPKEEPEQDKVPGDGETPVEDADDSGESSAPEQPADE